MSLRPHLPDQGQAKSNLHRRARKVPKHHHGKLWGIRGLETLYSQTSDTMETSWDWHMVLLHEHLSYAGLRHGDLWRLEANTCAWNGWPWMPLLKGSHVGVLIYLLNGVWAEEELMGAKRRGSTLCYPRNKPPARALANSRFEFKIAFAKCGNQNSILSLLDCPTRCSKVCCEE